AWIESVPHDLALAREAIRNRDLKTLAVVAERSCLRMHASALAADPGILFWNGTTIELIHHVRKLRADGFPVFFTIDAGPHVKVFCSASELSAVTQSIRSVFNGDMIVARPGPGVYLVDEPERR
ncbi:MAG: diphosphomevalonate decarboxylase, partial [Myxococcota bacterium]